MLDPLAEAAKPALDGAQALTLGLVVGAFNALVELAKAAINALAARRRNGNGDAPRAGLACKGIDAHTSSQLDGVFAVVTKTDDRGTPLVYGGRVVADKLDEVVMELRAVSTEIRAARGKGE